MLDTRQEHSEELDRFAYQHRVRKKSDKEGEPRDKGKEVEEEVERERQRKRGEREEGEKEAAEMRAIADDPEMARVYVEWLKNRSKRAATAIALKSKMQKALLSELWERVAEKQERTFDEEIAKRVLDQSRYEKQIVTKLCEVREQKNIMAENQKVVEDITVEAKEVEHRASYERAQDLVSKRQKDIEIECRRMCELRRRLLMQKIRKIRENHWRFCRDIVDDLASIALNVANHRRVNDGCVSLVLLSEWKTLFLKSQPIFDEELPYIGKHKQPSEQKFEMLLKSDTWMKVDKMDLLRDALFDDYLETNPPWNESLPELTEELQDLVKLGHAVLGYIVHRLLDFLYAHPVDRSQTLLQKFKNVTIVLGIGNPTVYELIRALLDRSAIRTVRMEDAINYCLERYVRHFFTDGYEVLLRRIIRYITLQRIYTLRVLTSLYRMLLERYEILRVLVLSLSSGIRAL